MVRTLAALTACAALAGACMPVERAPARAETLVSEIAAYPHGAFLENGYAPAEGGLVFTSYLDRTLLRWTGAGAPAPLTSLPHHPVAVLPHGEGFVLTAHGAPFTQGPAFTATNRFLVLDSGGVIVRETPAPEALFLNGMVALDDGAILAADSLAGRIWRYEPETGALSVWLEDALLTPDAALAPNRPGANGLKRKDSLLYISNSSRGAIFSVPITANRPAGPLLMHAAPGPVDDFTFLADGAIAAATHGAALLRVEPDGAVSPILEQGCDGCTAVFSDGADGLIVLTTGNLLEGGSAPARVLRVVPAQGP